MENRRQETKAAKNGDGDMEIASRSQRIRMRHHIEDFQDGPVCEKCGRPMTAETWFRGIGVKRFWFCTSCKIRVPAAN